MIQNLQEYLAIQISLLRLCNFSQAEQEGRVALPFPPDKEGIINASSLARSKQE